MQLLSAQPKLQNQLQSVIGQLSLKSCNVLLNTNQATLKFTAFYSNEMSEGNIYH